MGANHADVADVVLGARVLTTGDVDVDGGVESDALLKLFGELNGVFFCSGGRELATGGSGASDETARNVSRFVAKASSENGFFGSFEFVVGDVGDEKVLPDGETDIAGAVFVSDVTELVYLIDGSATDWNDDAEVVISVGLFVRSIVAVFDFRNRNFASFELSLIHI